MTTRPVRALHEAVRDDAGDLITYRAMPTASLPMGRLDPFLFLNHHGPQVYPSGNQGLPFGPHPHRGFETVTFIVAGDLVHDDSAGHVSAIGAGGVQWMTAGRGVVHSELSSDEFKARGGALEILQLWVNLPARLKMNEPRYVGLPDEQVPLVALDEGAAIVRPISGLWDGARGPVEPLADVHLASVHLGDGARYASRVALGRTVFVYVVRGRVRVGETLAAARHVVELGDGETVAVEALSDAMLILGHAEPFGEPIASYGPFVMNTREEIEQAILDYRAGRFGG